MKNADLLDKLTSEKIVAIIRGIPDERADETVDAMIRGGIILLEATLNTDGALNMISRWREKYGDQVIIGAGTVLDLQMAKDAVAAGAQFIVSPNLDEDVIAYGLTQEVAVTPGTMTPTEIVRAMKAGAAAVKVFPSGSLGLSYIKEIRAPLSNIPMMATGGIGLHNIREFLDTGIVAVGLGGNLVNKQLVQEGRYDEIENLARQFVHAAKGISQA